VDARVLLVEAGASIREVTALGLEVGGFSVTTADDGAIGLERLAWSDGTPSTRTSSCSR